MTNNKGTLCNIPFPFCAAEKEEEEEEEEEGASLVNRFC